MDATHGDSTASAMGPSASADPTKRGGTVNPRTGPLSAGPLSTGPLSAGLAPTNSSTHPAAHSAAHPAAHPTAHGGVPDSTSSSFSVSNLLSGSSGSVAKQQQQQTVQGQQQGSVQQQLTGGNFPYSTSEYNKKTILQRDVIIHQKQAGSGGQATKISTQQSTVTKTPQPKKKKSKTSSADKGSGTKPGTVGNQQPPGSLPTAGGSQQPGQAAAEAAGLAKQMQQLNPQMPTASGVSNLPGYSATDQKSVV